MTSLPDMIDVIVIIYWMTSLIYSNTFQNTKFNIKEVLRRPHANGLFARADKCKFHVTSCEYLGYMLCRRPHMAPYKVQLQ